MDGIKLNSSIICVIIVNFQYPPTRAELQAGILPPDQGFKIAAFFHIAIPLSNAAISVLHCMNCFSGTAKEHTVLRSTFERVVSLLRLTDPTSSCSKASKIKAS